RRLDEESARAFPSRSERDLTTIGAPYREPVVGAILGELPVAAPREVLDPYVEVGVGRVVGDPAAIRGEAWTIVGSSRLDRLTSLSGTVEPDNAARVSVGHGGGIDEGAVVRHGKDRGSEGGRILHAGQHAERRTRGSALFRIELRRQE